MTATTGIDKPRRDAADAASSNTTLKPPAAPDPPYMADTPLYTLGQLSAGSSDSLSTNNKNTTIVEINSDSEDDENAAALQTTSKPVAQLDFKMLKSNRKNSTRQSPRLQPEAQLTLNLQRPRTRMPS